MHNLILNIQLFGGRGANFTIKKDVIAKNVDNTDIIIPRGTKVKDVIVFAGDDRKRKIDEIDNLINRFGGKKKNWSKRKAHIRINNQPVEIHYYQNKKDNIGRVKYKIKRWL